MSRQTHPQPAIRKHRWPAVAALVIFLTSCLAPFPIGPATRTPSAPVSPSLMASPSATGTPPPSPTSTPTSTPAHLAERVLIISFDGLRPDVIDLAPMNSLQAMMQRAAYSLTAQTIYPSSTLPSHSSMLTGLCPSEHLVDWNDYLPERGFALGTDLFDLAEAAGKRTIMVVGKEKLRQVTEPASTDEFVFINDRDTEVARQAAEILKDGFDVMFIHFATIDDMGHEYDWLSPEQLSVAYRGGEALQTVLTALEQAGLRESTLIIVTADHGGHEGNHGSSHPEDMTIPWVASGPGVQFGRLDGPVNTTDTAATAAWALGLPIPAEWDGIPVYEAFGLTDPVERPAPRCQ